MSEGPAKVIFNKSHVKGEDSWGVEIEGVKNICGSYIFEEDAQKHADEINEALSGYVKRGVCEWKKLEYGEWERGCLKGAEFCLQYEPPEAFCPSCGGTIKEAK